MSWIQYENPKPVNGEKYDALMNLHTGAFIHIDKGDNQSDEDINLYVWTEFPGVHEKQLYYGTPVECMRVIEKLAERFAVTGLSIWD